MAKNTSDSSLIPSILQSATGPVPYPLTNDYLFRAVLQKNQLVLKGLVSSLLHLPMEEILSITIRNPIVLGEEIDSKTFILDLDLLLNNNQLLNIEMQVTNTHEWPERSIGYLAREFDNLNRGEDYLTVLPAHHIGILTFTLFPEYSEFYSTYKLLNVKSHHLYSDKFAISVLDLSQIEHATKEDKEYRLDYWAKLFLAQTWEEIKMLAEKNEAIKEAAATMYAVSAEENIRLQCEARERYEKDRRSLYSSGKKEGEEIGLKRGEEIGLKRGEEIGLRQGRKQGEERLSALINCLINDGHNDEIIKVSTDVNLREELYQKYHL